MKTKLSVLLHTPTRRWLPLAIAIASLSAHSDDLLTEEDLVSDLPLVSSAARMAQPLSMAPASVTIIDRAMIDASGAQSWPDLFRLVPGFQVYSINGNRHGIDYHGIGEEFPNHLEVMVDGRSVYEPLFSTVHWELLGINLEDIDRIEVIRGSNVPSYGSNAFQGAVNIVTRQPIQDSGWALRTTYGSLETQNASLRINNTLGNLDYRFSLGYRHNSGFPAVEDGPMEDGQELHQSEFRGSYTPNSLDSFDFHLGYSRNKMGFGDPDHPDEYLPSEFDSHFQSIKWQRALRNGDELQLHLYHNRLNAENRAVLGDLSELLADELDIDIPTATAILGSLGVSDRPLEAGFRSVTSDRVDLELEHKVSLGQSLRGVWGAGIRDEKIDAEALLDPETSVNQTSYRLFGNLEWTPDDHWVINTGLMAEYNDIVKTILSPRLAVHYRFNDFHSLRLGLARANRSPSLLEANEFSIEQQDGLLLSAVRRAADDIAEEKLESYELGFVSSYPQHGLTVDLRIYREQVRDGLEQYQEPVTYSPSFDDRIAVLGNVYHSTMDGIELQLRYQPSSRTLITGHLSHNQFRGNHPKTLTADPVLRVLDDNVPATSAGLLISQQLTDRWTLSGSLFYQDEVEFNDSGDWIEQYTRADAKLNYQVSLGKSHLDIALIAQNIGSSYSEFHNNNRFDTRYFIQLQIALP